MTQCIAPKSVEKRIAIVLAVALTAVAAIGPAAAQAADMSLLEYSGPDRLQRIVAAAKKEGGFTLYTSIAEKDLNPLIKPFEARYGVKVNVWRAGADKVLQRAVTEYRAKKHDVDAIHTASPEMEAFSREKVLQPVLSPAFKDLLPGAVPAHRESAVTLLTVFVQAYNTDKLKREELPRTFRDLLDPKWKGQLGIEAKDEDWFAAVVEHLGGKPGIDLFRDIAAKNGFSARAGHSLLTNLIVSGEVPLGLTVYNYMAAQAKAKGAPIDWFVIEPALARSNAIGITRHARNPNAALLFYEFMLSDAQALLAGLDYVPSSTRHESPLGRIRPKLLDPIAALDERAKWEKVYADTLAGR